MVQEGTRMPASPTVVLAISRQLGSGGSYIGQGVARRLGLKYIDREILEEAARQLDTDDATTLEHLEERVASVWLRMTRHLSVGPPEALFTPPRLATAVYEEDLFQIERQVIREFAARENCVIVGRASTFVLKHQAGVVRLFVHAPEAWRVEQLAKMYGGGDLPALHEMVRRADHDREKFVHAVTGCDWFDARHYDMTINPATIGGLDAAVELVTAVVQRRLQA